MLTISYFELKGKPATALAWERQFLTLLVARDHQLRSSLQPLGLLLLASLANSGANMRCMLCIHTQF